MVYTFTMRIICAASSSYQCDVSTSHEMTYAAADIECKIKGGDISLIKSSSAMNAYSLILDGWTFTFDPNSDSKRHLQPKWNCADVEGDSCNFRGSVWDSTSGKITIDFSD